MRPVLGLLLAGVVVTQAGGQPAPSPGLQRLLKAYPDQLASAEPNALVWRDGTRMVFDDGRQEMDPDRPSLRFQMEEMYPRGDAGVPPAANADPGRVRYLPFFQKMYGATPGEVEKRLVTIHWFSHRPLRVTRVNGVDRQVQAVSEELGKLPPALRRFVERPAGAYHWRLVEGTRRPSPHAFGIALDIDASVSDYWRWAGPRVGTVPAYRNRIPLEIVRIFERHGFIWGGKWSHFDTMHFEYRPELLVE